MSLLFYRYWTTHFAKLNEHCYCHRKHNYKTLHFEYTKRSTRLFAFQLTLFVLKKCHTNPNYWKTHLHIMWIHKSTWEPCLSKLQKLQLFQNSYSQGEILSALSEKLQSNL